MPRQSSSEDIPETTKRVTRSSQCTTEVVEKKEKISEKKAKKTAIEESNKKKRKPATKSPNKEAAEKPSGSGRHKKATLKPKGHSQPHYWARSPPTVEQWELVHPDTIPKTRGRGRGRPGRGRGGVKKAPKRKGSKVFWGRAPPTAEQLAEFGREDGCKYVLSKPYRSSKSYRAHLEAEIAVANLYDSD